MKILQKVKNKDFIVLNLSDPQMCDNEWEDGHPYRSILEYTIDKLIQDYQPDLITVTGDLAYGAHYRSYETFAKLMAKHNIPWAPVWGNHDHQDGLDHLVKAAAMFKEHPLCLFEDGDAAYGHGNYILTVNEGDTPITALFMIDSHNSTEITLDNGEKRWAYDKLWPNQQEWIREQCAVLKADGYKDGMMMLHIPMYCYRAAAEMAFPGGRGGDSEIYGQQHELIAAHPQEDGVLATLKESDFITHVLAGHDHCNNFIVEYEGIKLMFAYKTGPGCYWQSTMNGGTVITIGEEGIKSVHQQYVDVSHLVEGKGIHEFVYNWDN